MKILYDHQAFTGAVFGGVSRYFTDLMQHMARFGHKSRLSLGFSNNFYLKNQPFFKGKNYSNWLGTALTSRVLSHANRFISAVALSGKSFDIFHPTFHNPYFLPFVGSKPFVLTFHDAIPEIYEETYGLLDGISFADKQKILDRAAHIIAISENTKKDVEKFYQIPPEKITVIHHGTHFIELAQTRTQPRPIQHKNYLLYVGSRGFYKNFLFLLDALAGLLQSQNLQLVCVGGGKFTPEELEAIEKNGLAGRVFQETTDDEGLFDYYQNAEAFIYPSEYEGFGLPILEAFAAECPVVLSNASCFPEIAGDAALYFELNDAASLQNQLNQLLNNPELRQRLITKGKKRVQGFTLENMARKTLAVYQKVLTNQAKS